MTLGWHGSKRQEIIGNSFDEDEWVIDVKKSPKAIQPQKPFVRYDVTYINRIDSLNIEQKTYVYFDTYVDEVVTAFDEDFDENGWLKPRED